MDACSVCGEVFSKTDEATGNYRQSAVSGLRHRRCPNVVHTCDVCGKLGADKSVAGQWRHEDCYIELKSQDTASDVAGWIVN